MVGLIVLAVFIRTITAIIPEVTAPQLVSLPDLLHVKDISELTDTWSLYNNINLETGRLLIGKSGGSAWSKASVPNIADEWTIEFIFRSTGTSKDAGFIDTNGLSLFLAESPNLNDFSNFGGPSLFDGFQFLFNNKEKPGMKIFSNDGSQKLQNSLASVIGNCEFTYLNSQVPFNLRVSYSKSNSNFKVQLDNNLCFQTNQVKFPSSNFHVGVAGDISSESEEVFEVLRLNVWDHLTTDAIDDHGLMNDGALKIDYKTVEVDSDGNPKSQQGDESFQPPSAIRESLLEKSRKYKEELERKEQQAQVHNEPAYNKEDSSQVPGIHSEQINHLIIQNSRLSSKLDSIESAIKRLEYEDDVANKNEMDSFTAFENNMSKKIVELLDAISQLNQKVIGEVREQQYAIDELDKKVDLLMKNHKELNYQASNPDLSAISETTSSYVRWTLISIIIVILVLIIIVYRLRHDVKHAKLL